MKSKKRIGIDMDGVLVDSLPTWLQAYRELSTDPLYPEHIKTYNFGQYAKFPKLLFDTLHLGDVFRKSPPMPGAIQGLEFLSKHHDVYIVSYVHAQCLDGFEQKLDWLQHWAPFFDRDKVIFTRQKHLISLDILVEDSPDNIEAWLKENPKSNEFMIRHSYNVAAQEFNYSVNSLMDVVNELVQLEAA